MKPSRRLERIPPYLFAELERKIAEKKAAGIDVICLGIGDPDTPTPGRGGRRARGRRARPGHPQYPSNRGRPELREAVARFYDRRFGVALDPDTEIIPALGAKECVFNLNLAFLDPGDAALAADPGYPVYTGGPLLADAEPVLMPLLPERGFAPDLDAISAADRERARLMYLNYPNNPTGAIVPDGLFEEAVEFAREHDMLVVHDASYTETTFDGYVAPSFLETPGAKEVGVEVFSLSKGYNMTGWRTAAIVGNAEAIERVLAAQDEHRLGHVRGRAAGGGCRARAGGRRAEMGEIYQRRRDLVCDALREIGVDVTPPKGTIYVWAPVPEGHTSESYCELVLEESAVVVSPGGAYGPNGEGFFRISLTIADERLSEAVERLRSSLGG